MFRVWNIALAVLAFNLSIFGTFLTRSGILSSVHTFADSGMAPFFLGFISLCLLGPFILLFNRRKQLKGEYEVTSLISRESTFLLNNLLLVGAAFCVFAGTVYPLISEALLGAKMTLDESFFNQVLGPVFAVNIVLMGICPLVGWGRAAIGNLARSLIYPLATALIIGVGLVLLGVGQWYAILAFSFSGFVITAMLFHWIRGVSARHGMREESYLESLYGWLWDSRSRLGGRIVHIAIVLMAIGVVGSSAYQTENEAILTIGESIDINNYTLTYDSRNMDSTPSKLIARVTLSVYDGEQFIGTLTPEKYSHRSYQQAVTEVAIHSTLREDLYAILGGFAEDGTIALKVLVNPLVVWIWIGGGLLLLGGVIAFWPESGRRIRTD